VADRFAGPLGVAVVATSALLLLSMGGAVPAAPVTLPAMVLALRRHPSRTLRRLGAVVGGLTTAEVVWAGVYVLAGEAQPWVWLLPAAVGALGGTFLARCSPPPLAARAAGGRAG
jgi:hypothetical protein